MIFVRQNNVKWIYHLDKYLYNRNHSKHSTASYQPSELWRIERNKLKRTVDTEVNDAQQRIKDKAKVALDTYKVYAYQEGDIVRVLESSLYRTTRTLLKAGSKKLIMYTRC